MDTFACCQSEPFCEEISVPNSLVYPDFEVYQNTFTLQRDVEMIMLWTDSKNATIGRVQGAFLDNVSITCQNKNLDNLFVEDISSCEFQFSPVFRDSTIINDIKYEWSFGDGNTSTEKTRLTCIVKMVFIQ